jgi:hypothetical protein
MRDGDAGGVMGIWIARESLAGDAAVASRSHTWPCMFEELRPPGYLVAMAYPELSAAARRPVTFREVGAADF